MIAEIEKTSIEELNEIWKQGYKAGKSGASAVSNPFLQKNDMEKASTWIDGWHSAVVHITISGAGS